MEPLELWFRFMLVPGWSRQPSRDPRENDIHWDAAPPEKMITVRSSRTVSRPVGTVTIPDIKMGLNHHSRGSVVILG